jgi:hypothetical protein
LDHEFEIFEIGRTPTRAPRLVLLLCLAFLLPACASRPPSPDTFAFAVLGDIGYGPAEERHFLETMRRIDAAAPAFTVHVGDFMGHEPCTDEFYRKRRRQFDESAAPFVLTPGDNEWEDCPRWWQGPRDSLESLAALRRIFFPDRWSMGRRRMETLAQDQCIASPPPGCGCAAHPENRQWRHKRVHFVTLNIPGHRNNMGHGARSDQEVVCRNAANAAWLERAVDAARSADVRALVVLTQANPWEPYPRRYRHVFDGFLDQMASIPPRLGKPILFVHGDTHHYRVTDFLGTDGQPVGGITRLETHGTPTIGWVLVGVDTARDDPFDFGPRLVAISVPGR